jgi:hypothetical protein
MIVTICAVRRRVGPSSVCRRCRRCRHFCRGWQREARGRSRPLGARLLAVCLELPEKGLSSFTAVQAQLLELLDNPA